MGDYFADTVYCFHIENMVLINFNKVLIGFNRVLIGMNKALFHVITSPGYTRDRAPVRTDGPVLATHCCEKRPRSWSEKASGPGPGQARPD